jgi:hypothetical protein
MMCGNEPTFRKRDGIILAFHDKHAGRTATNSEAQAGNNLDNNTLEAQASSKMNPHYPSGFNKAAIIHHVSMKQQSLIKSNKVGITHHVSIK